jgi:tetraacyldisaccharide 4'-kinase
MDPRAIFSGQRNDLAAGLLRWSLRVGSVPYSLAMRLRNLAYDRRWLAIHELPVPIIGVGNLTVGGTGKTPCVAWLARFYRELGWRVAIVSRGYGADVGGINDEARELEALLPDVPHVQDADRVAAAQIAVEELDAQIILLDDGFQHRRLARSLDIVLIDATCPWGFGWCLPGGLLREPTSGLRRAGAVLLTRCNHVSASELQRIEAEAQRLAPGAVIAQSIHRPQQWRSITDQTAPLDELRQKRVIAIAAIGHPEPFFESLTSLGLEIAQRFTWPDHHRFTRDDVQQIASAAERHRTAAVVCTHKDLVKLAVPTLGGQPVWALQIGLELTANAPAFRVRLQHAIAR